MDDKRADIFDRWAADYDRSVAMSDAFPFIGYERVLDEIVRKASPEPGARVLDLGIGTGNLASMLVEARCEVWGVDFSDEMLKRAQKRLPGTRLIQADVRELPKTLPNFHRIVSAYVLHEFDLQTKVSLLSGLVRQHLSADGLVVIGDIAFPSVKEREKAHRLWKDAWDEDEHYWALDEALPLLASANLGVEYNQISPCAGVLVIRPTQP